ncbi:hypothetical protein F889_00383 [Acinetobacter colistiniresistens]|uniref:Spore coat protein U/FanG domain-containing protein n=1 Tax=Acinetobacter colistiniresistens TaxID=280145 RepID=N9PRM9_9GAMM|nr:spore coat U domain-containing protein [Acinetobacter colistiniresistens]ENX36224.1 hypothetical protein F889_00383 [Acinetobacter colistiniresistens]
MKLILSSRINKNLFALGLALFGNDVYADCIVNNTASTTISIPSIALYESGEASTQFKSGLSCSGFSLGLVNTTYLKYKIDQMSNVFRNAATGETLSVQLYDTDNHVISQGQERDMSSLSVLNFFSGPDGSLPFYYNIPAGQNVSPGTYLAETPLKVKWYYSVPRIAAIGLGLYFESPGFKRGGIFERFDWGRGSDSSQTLIVKILPDCRILTQDVNFGTAAFAGQFEPVSTSMGIRCSINTPYSVSLNNGLYPQNGKQRTMKSQSGNDYLKYEIYKNTSTERWGSGSEAWSSLNATVNPGLHDGKTQQRYLFTTRILDSNSDFMPAGNYQDAITVEVSF